MVPSHLVLQCSAMCAITFQLLHDIVVVVVMDSFYHTGVHLDIPKRKQTDSMLAIPATTLMQPRLTISNMYYHHQGDRYRFIARFRNKLTMGDKGQSP